MTLSMVQRRVLEDWMRSKGIAQCPACGENRWHFAEAAYVRALFTSPGDKCGDHGWRGDRVLVTEN